MTDRECMERLGARLYISNRLNEAGRKAGEKWIAIEGEQIASEAARRIIDILDDDGRVRTFLRLDDAYTPAERLYFVIAGDDEFNRERSNAAEFWESLCDDSQPEDEFLAGFARCLVPLAFRSRAA